MLLLGDAIHCNIHVHVLIIPPLWHTFIVTDTFIHVCNQEISPPVFTCCSLDKKMSCELMFPHVDNIHYIKLILLLTDSGYVNN